MKNLFKARIAPVLGIIALIAVIGFSMIGCKDDDDGGDGTFTVTGIPSEYNGKYAYFYGMVGNTRVFGAQSYATGGLYGIEQARIENGSVILNMWVETNGSRYSGNDTVVENALVIDLPEEDSFISQVWESIVFSNGSATKTWSSGKNHL